MFFDITPLLGAEVITKPLNEGDPVVTGMIVGAYTPFPHQDPAQLRFLVRTRGGTLTFVDFDPSPEALADCPLTIKLSARRGWGPDPFD